MEAALGCASSSKQSTEKRGHCSALGAERQALITLSGSFSLKGCVRRAETLRFYSRRTLWTASLDASCSARRGGELGEGLRLRNRRPRITRLHPLPLGAYWLPTRCSRTCGSLLSLALRLPVLAFSLLGAALSFERFDGFSECEMIEQKKLHCLLQHFLRLHPAELV